MLLIAGLALSAALGGVIPSPFDDAGTIQRCFEQTSNAVRASAVCLFGSAVPLAIYAATASARLRTLGVTAPGATIALAGGPPTWVRMPRRWDRAALLRRAPSTAGPGD